MSPLSIILLPRVKKGILSESREKSAQYAFTVHKPKQSRTALNKYVAGFWCQRNSRCTFSLEQGLWWSWCYGQKQRFVNWWTGVVWITGGLLWYFVSFLSVWTLILTAPIHCSGLASKWCEANENILCKFPFLSELYLK